MPAGAGGAGLFPGSLAGSVSGAAWAWLLAGLLGASLLSRLRGGEGDAPSESDALRPLAWAVAGFGVLALVALGAGAAGALTPRGVLGGAVVLTAAGALAGGAALRRAGRASFQATRAALSSDGAAGWAGLAGLALVVALAAPWSMVPTAHYDDLVYHLGLPRQALLSGAWPAWPHFHHALMPATWEVSYLIPLALRGGCGPQLMNLVALAGLAATSVVLARRGGGGPAARAAATLLVSSGVAVAAAWTAGNDLFVGLALAVALERGLRGGRAGLVEAGACAGAACAAKYTAWPAAFALVLAVAVASSGPLARRARSAVLVALVAGVFVAPWSLRSALATGSPAYPAFHGVLGGSPWDAEGAALQVRDSAAGAWPERGIASLPMSVRDVLVDQRRLGEPGGLSRVFVVLALVGLAFARRVRDGAALAVFVLVAWSAWCGTSLMLRFFIAPAVALTPFAAAALTAALGRLPGSRRTAALLAAAGLLLGVAGWQAALTTWFGTRGLPPLAILRDREALLPSLLDMARAERDMAERLPEGARVLCIAEARMALVPRRALADSALDPPLIAVLLRGITRPEEVPSRLAPLATHVLVSFREVERWNREYGWSRRVGEDESALLGAWLAAAAPVATWGQVSLYELHEGPATPGP